MRDPYAIMVSELMLQQTQVATVIPFYIEWLRRFPDVGTLAAASESDVLHAWQGLGYYSRARNLHAAAKAIIEKYGGAFPTTPEELQKLPGLGRYTANALATFAFDSAVPIVEANTARLFARLLDLRDRIDSGAGRRRLWDFAASLLPEANGAAHNSALMDLGALVCVNGEPKCAICPVRTFCRADNPATLPIKANRAKLKLLVENHLFSRAGDSVLLEQSADRWRGMWILPRLANERQTDQRVLYSAEFPFTHHRITLRVCEAVPDAAETTKRRAFSHDELDTIPMPSPHRRALNALLQSEFNVGR
ncbi:MAG: A/G-specific adenine glycosylase [Verrucomicrobiota bacterium]|nr:A/G-specific adenine glycosylase [Verrucomicrobiota bacterium]